MEEGQRQYSTRDGQSLVVLVTSNSQALVKQPNFLTGQQIGTSILTVGSYLLTLCWHLTASPWCCCGAQSQLTLIIHWTRLTAYRSLPATRTQNLFSSCRPSGGTGAIFLVPEASFQLLLSCPGSNLACHFFGTAVGLRCLYPCDLRKAQVAFLLVISDIIPVPMLPSCDLCPQLLFLGEAEAPPEYTSCKWVNTASASGTEHSTAQECTAASCLRRSLCLDVQTPGVATAGLVTPSVSVVSLPLQSLCVLPSEELLAPLVCPFVHQGLLGPLATLSAWHP